MVSLDEHIMIKVCIIKHVSFQNRLYVDRMLDLEAGPLLYKIYDDFFQSFDRCMYIYIYIYIHRSNDSKKSSMLDMNASLRHNNDSVIETTGRFIETKKYDSMRRYRKKTCDNSFFLHLHVSTCCAYFKS
jgi:hypothetical protein